MKIECILKRDGGTRTDIGGVAYHFAPLSDGAHVAEVAETAHIDRFLSIPEGYRVYHGQAELKSQPELITRPDTVKPVEQSKPGVMLSGSDQHPPEFTIAGKVYTQLDVVKIAFAASGLTSDEWNDLGDDERAAKLDIALDDLVADEAADDQGDENSALVETESRAALVERYEAKFGRKPHHKTGIEKIKAELGD